MLKKVFRATAIFLAVCLLSACLCSCKKDDGALTKITLSEVTHSVFYSPQYAALNLGFFEDEGLDIELSTGQGADAVAAAVLSGQVDVGFAGPEAAIYVYNEGRDNYLKVFAQMTQRDGSFLIAREENADFKWTDLKGAHILPGRKGGVPYMTFEYVLKQNGIDTKNDVYLDNSVQFAMMTSAFVAGTGDYTTAFEPTGSMLESEGKGYVVAAVGSEAGEIPYTAYFTSKKFIEKNPETVQAFANAVARGEKWCAEHSAEEIAKVVAPSFPDTELSLLTSSIQRYIDIDAWCDTPVMKEEAFNKLQDVMTSAGELEKRADFNSVVDNSFAKKAS
ncbi:MAG: ABC transporter substrate-binding protein [Oscillospiraceae bacterium]|nr:ABC transporter substrate-binding protein [Oscillospiraceae bacterium]